jgi:hypothetical protein
MGIPGHLASRFSIYFSTVSILETSITRAIFRLYQGSRFVPPIKRIAVDKEL